MTHAIDAVGGYPGKRRIRRDSPLDHVLGQPGLGGESDALWYMGVRQAFGVCCPVPGQVQGPVDEGMSLARDIGGKDTDLAVGDLANRACVLARIQPVLRGSAPNKPSRNKAAEAATRS
ncbi:hypothetical protein FHR87_003840 [Azomonas macrocytogenes]|uniref:Uncharacterized protein n=1 Tax=Azomonas macrocytogenes TaxID=69962 RepID=A0A839T7F9_AZOMA|nr:hypothetical protein [Azomonas macrocytogenes]